MSLIPGSGSGVTLVSGFPRNITNDPRERLSNRIYGILSPLGIGENSRIFYSSGGNAFSFNISDNTVRELSGQGMHWIIPASGVGGANAWVVTDRGRVTLVDANMEAMARFPVLTGVRMSSPPLSYNDRLYLCDEDGRVLVIDENARQSFWETSFAAAVRSPPSFLTFTARRESNTYAAVYPKSFFGEIWLLDVNGKAYPNWPAPISINEDGSIDDFGIGFGSPQLFVHNERLLVAFVNQSGQLLVYDETAELVKPFPVNLNGVFFLQPVFDGEYLCLVSSNGTLFRVSMNGEVLYQQIRGLSVREEGYITVFDTNGDGIPEIFLTGDGNALHGYTRNFRSLEGFPLPVWGKPFFIPAQGPRRSEVFGIGMDRRLYRYQFR
jgi:outer membrane protein assembly factor BamB